MTRALQYTPFKNPGGALFFFSSVKQPYLNPLKDKTSCIVIGFKKQRYQVEVELLAEPLMSGDIQVKLKQQFKWLGQVLSSAGLSESVAATVEDQEGKICGTTLEIVQIVI